MFSVKYYSFIKYIFHPMLVRPKLFISILYMSHSLLNVANSIILSLADVTFGKLTISRIALHSEATQRIGTLCWPKVRWQKHSSQKTGVFKKHLCFGLVMNFCSFYTVFKSEPRLLPFNSLYEVSGFLNVFFYAHLPSILVNSFNFLESNDPPHAAIIDIPFIFFTAIMYRKNVSCKWQHFNIASTLGIKKCTKHLSDKGFPISVNLLYGIKKCTKHLSDKGFPISVNLLYV